MVTYLLCYLIYVCIEIPSSKIFPNFSKDGLKKIPLLLNTSSRFEALEARRKVFDKLGYSSFDASKKSLKV